MKPCSLLGASPHQVGAEPYQSPSRFFPLGRGGWFGSGIFGGRGSGGVGTGVGLAGTGPGIGSVGTGKGGCSGGIGTSGGTLGVCSRILILILMLVLVLEGLADIDDDVSLSTTIMGYSICR
ncbi:MAG: hypothetical protein JO170_02160 [Verrucomicrobia bacterium]|nr:hypothetical protein [Verrucomicrobiota bacterium]